MPRLQITVSHDLAEAAELLRSKRRYRTLSELFQAYVRYDALTQQPHTLSETWASHSPEDRDKLDARMLALVKDGKGERGSALKRMIYDTIKFMCGPDAQVPRVEDVLKALALGEEEYQRRRSREP